MSTPRISHRAHRVSPENTDNNQIVFSASSVSSLCSLCEISSATSLSPLRYRMELEKHRLALPEHRPTRVHAPDRAHTDRFPARSPA
jgi:hypothetical protein